VSGLCDRWEWSKRRRLLKRKKTPTADISSSAEALGLPFSEEELEGNAHSGSAFYH